MKSIIVAAAIALSVAVSDGAWAQTLTECGGSDGYAYYFVGGLVPAGKGGWQKDGIDGGRWGGSGPLYLWLGRIGIHVRLRHFVA